MTNIGEMVAVAVITMPDTCPFCESKEPNPDFDELVINNDSTELAGNLGGMPTVVMDDAVVVDKKNDYWVWENYWKSSTTSAICLNAHHVIPGNATLADASLTALHKWMAGTVTYEKTFYNKKASKDKLLQKYKSKTTAQEKIPDQDINFFIEKSKGGNSHKINRKKITEEKHVTGKIDYNINDQKNGIWLPNSKAVWSWARYKAYSAKDKSGNVRTLGQAYSYNAIEETGYQFHDAHPAYSEALIQELLSVEKKVDDRSKACVAGCDKPQKKEKGSHPAPARLAKAIYDLADETKNFLSTVNSPFFEPWYTSGFSLDYDGPKHMKPEI